MVAQPIDATYHLSFDDEFNGTSLDTSRWNNLAANISGPYSQVQFTPADVAVGNGLLDLSATQGSTSGRPYSAGFIFTKQTFSTGYWEARAKMPAAAHGMWPAFWMNTPPGTYQETDILEWLGNTPSTSWQTYHPPNDGALTGGVGFGDQATGTDWSADFHTYGMLWSPSSISWYIDGVMTFEVDQSQAIDGETVDISLTAQNTILNNAIGGWNGNAVDASTVFPGHFLVDYVHVYSSDPSVPTVTPEPGYVPGGDGTAVIDQSNQSEIDLMGLATADGYTYKNDMLNILSGNKIIDTLRLHDSTLNGFSVEPPTATGSVNIVAITDPLNPPPSLPNLTGVV